MTPEHDEITVQISTKCPHCGERVDVNVGPTRSRSDRGNTERMYTLKDLEPILGLKNRQLRQLVYEGRLPATKFGSGSGRDPWRVRESDVIAFQKGRS